jgi:hypothetical protein
MCTPLSPQVLQLRATAHLHAQRPPICAVCATSAPGLAAERRYGSPTASAGAGGDADGARPMAYSTPTQPRGGGARAATFGDASCLDGPGVPASSPRVPREYPVSTPRVPLEYRSLHRGGLGRVSLDGPICIAKDGGEQCALACKARQTLPWPGYVWTDPGREEVVLTDRGGKGMSGRTRGGQGFSVDSR